MKRKTHGKRLSAKILEKEDEKTVEEYIRRTATDKSLKLGHPLSALTLKKYREKLGKIAREIRAKFKKSLKQITEDELKQYIAEEINNSEDYEDSVKWDYRKFLKPFFTKIRPDFDLSWLRVGRPQPTVEAEDLFTSAEIDLLRGAQHTVQDKAKFETLRELGCSPEEFLALNIGDVEHTENGALIHLHKGKHPAREIEVFNAAPLLFTWIDSYPCERKSDSPLWIDSSPNTKFERLEWRGLAEWLERSRIEAKIQRPIWLYLFRHTRITELVRLGMNEGTLRKFAGWTATSRMPAFYVHLVSADVSEALRKISGIETVEKSRQQPRVPQHCPRCGELCSFDSDNCRKCGFPLSPEAQLKAQVNKLEQEKRFEERLASLEIELKKTRQQEAIRTQMFKQMAEGKLDPETVRVYRLILEGRIIPDQPVTDPEAIEVASSYLAKHGVPNLNKLEMVV